MTYFNYHDRFLHQFIYPCCSAEGLNHWLRDFTTYWFLCTTDAGSNEMGARRIIHTDIKDIPNTFFLDVTCLQHSHHLVSLSALKAADRSLKTMRDWSYYSSLAVCANVCRDVGKELYGAWVQCHGAVSAKKACKSLFPKACAGRWSGCDKPEQRFLQCQQHNLAPVLEEVLVRKGGKSQTSESGSLSVNDLAIEEAKAYSEKMGKWRKRCLECVNDTLWWRCVEVMHKTRQPLTHLSNFLQKTMQTAKHFTRSEHVNHMYELCTGKALHIFQEFETVWSELQQSGCVFGDDDESLFVRNFARPGRVSNFVGSGRFWFWF